MRGGSSTAGLRTDVLRAVTAAEEAVEKGLSPWNPELAGRLFELLYLGARRSSQLDRELRELEGASGDSVYTELIYLLCHLRFEGAEAKQHWSRISDHRKSLEERLQAPVDLRVAIVDYFIQVYRGLENPAIIEMRVLARTQALAYRDELTGLRNYRYFVECLAHETARSYQYHAPLSLLMLDIDNFKAYNDRFGHDAGNEALAALARLITEVVRIVDVPVRYGGEEFAVIMPSTSKRQAEEAAERTRRAVERYSFREDEAGRLTVSIGVATCPGDANRAADLLRRADQALYSAKTAGKNQVQLYGRDRRSYRRVRVELPGTLRQTGEKQDLSTLDLSEGGLRFVTGGEVTVGTLVDIELELPAPHPRVSLAGRIVQTAHRPGSGLQAAVRIVEIGHHDLNRLVSFARKADR